MCAGGYHETIRLHRTSWPDEYAQETVSNEHDLQQGHGVMVTRPHTDEPTKPWEPVGWVGALKALLTRPWASVGLLPQIPLSPPAVVLAPPSTAADATGWEYKLLIQLVW